MKVSIEKMQALERKINQLKTEQDKIEQVIANYFIEVLRINNAFYLDFNTLIGGLLEVIEVINSNSERKEVWRNLGQKFYQSRLKPKTKRFKINSLLEKDLVSD